VKRAAPNRARKARARKRLRKLHPTPSFFPVKPIPFSFTVNYFIASPSFHCVADVHLIPGIQIVYF
jgi:hypothetical protein